MIQARNRIVEFRLIRVLVESVAGEIDYSFSASKMVGEHT